MSGVEVFNVPRGREAEIVARMQLDPTDTMGTIEWLVASDPALVLVADGRPYTVVGFVPLAVMTTSAYAWMQWTPEIYKHRVASTRICREVFNAALAQYSSIFGHCSFGPKPMRLFERLGARFGVDPQNGKPFFVIGRA